MYALNKNGATMYALKNSLLHFFPFFFFLLFLFNQGKRFTSEKESVIMSVSVVFIKNL